jgi:hypothetical protein
MILPFWIGSSLVHPMCFFSTCQEMARPPARAGGAGQLSMRRSQSMDGNRWQQVVRLFTWESANQPHCISKIGCFKGHMRLEGSSFFCLFLSTVPTSNQASRKAEIPEHGETVKPESRGAKAVRITWIIDLIRKMPTGRPMDCPTIPS